MSDKIGCVILAAGEGTRLKMNVPKPLAPVMGRTLVDYSIEALASFIEDSKCSGEISLVLGHKREEVRSYLDHRYKKSDLKLSFSVQKKQLGTADALKSYFDGVASSKSFDYTIVMCADTPLISSADLGSLYDKVKSEGLDGIAATFTSEIPKGYGRIVKGGKGFRIVEEKDANDIERKITEVNSGLYLLKTSFILDHLYSLDNKNKSGEFYLTDLFQENYNVAPLLFEEESTFLGVNNPMQLGRAEKLLQMKKKRALAEEGVYFVDMSHTFVEEDVVVEPGVTIFPNCYLHKGTQVKSGARLEPGCILKNTLIESGVELKAYSYLEDAIVRESAAIGPFARIRPGSDIGPDSKIGNFVETKKVKLERGVKVSHLSYVGDAEVGENTNIGCGFITCNYDGVNKHLTKIGKNSFIGSDSQMIAPVTVGDGCYVASGSTINQDLEDGDFAIARTRQSTKKGMAKRFIKSKK